MRLSYANIMSTIAMFAAVSTGTGYAAATLGKDSVRTREIKNGQVTLADLHPSVRAKLGKAPVKPVTGGGGTTARPGVFANTNVAPVGAWTPCTASCGSTIAGYHAGPRVAVKDTGLGASPKVNLRWTGSVTNNGPKAAHFTLYVFSGSTTSLPFANGAKFSCSTRYAGIAPGQTLTPSDLTCNDNPAAMTGATGAQNRYMRSQVELLGADDPAFPSGITSTLALEAQPVG